MIYDKYKYNFMLLTIESLYFAQMQHGDNPQTV